MTSAGSLIKHKKILNRIKVPPLARKQMTFSLGAKKQDLINISLDLRPIFGSITCSYGS